MIRNFTSFEKFKTYVKGHVNKNLTTLNIPYSVKQFQGLNEIPLAIDKPPILEAYFPFSIPNMRVAEFLINSDTQYLAYELPTSEAFLNDYLDLGDYSPMLMGEDEDTFDFMLSHHANPWVFDFEISKTFEAFNARQINDPEYRWLALLHGIRNSVYIKDFTEEGDFMYFEPEADEYEDFSDYLDYRLNQGYSKMELHDLMQKAEMAWYVLSNFSPRWSINWAMVQLVGVYNTRNLPLLSYGEGSDLGEPAILLSTERMNIYSFINNGDYIMGAYQCMTNIDNYKKDAYNNQKSAEKTEAIIRTFFDLGAYQGELRDFLQQRGPDASGLLQK